MNYRSILVYFDMVNTAAARLQLALKLAARFEAHLAGVDRNSVQRESLPIAASQHNNISEQRHDSSCSEIEPLFRAEVERAKACGEWLSARENAERQWACPTHHADLIIAGMDDPLSPQGHDRLRFPLNLVLSVGSPVLLVPTDPKIGSLGHHIAIGWDGSREATRAIRDALPFMHRADKITIITVRDTTHRTTLKNHEPSCDIAAMISRHGLKSELVEVNTTGRASIGETLLSTAYGCGADLLVMGGSGVARWKELILGRTTRSVLESTNMPVLMSH